MHFEGDLFAKKNNETKLLQFELQLINWYLWFFFYQIRYTFYKQQVNNIKMKINMKKVTTQTLNLTHYLKSDRVIKMKTLKNKR